jgi:uncharacterized protein YPO0396
MSAPDLKMDKLVSLTLVNWYLIGAKTIDLSGGITLVRGQNGSGKSSILDGIQTVLAGGDEKELLMNAASSDGHRSGRDIRSYALGVVNEADGQQACKPRSESNTYLCMTFRKKDGRTYNAGISIHATVGQQAISKRLFLYEGGELSAMDFMLSENQIMTWKQLEQRLKDAGGLLSLPTTAQDYRYQLSELMSAPGQGSQISPQMMLSTLKKAISFKEQKCISTFVKEHILPQRTIDVIKIQNDYSQYEEIERLIKEAQSRVESLKDVTRQYSRHCDEKKRSWGYQWAALEASVSVVEEELSEKSEAADDKRDELKRDEARMEEIGEQLPDVQSSRDKAKSALDNSAYKQEKAAAENRLKVIGDGVANQKQQINEARIMVEALLALKTPQDMSSPLVNAIADAQEKLKKTAAIGEADLMLSWPQSYDHIEDILVAIKAFRPLTEKLQSERDSAQGSLKTLESKLAEQQSTYQALEQGDAKLMHSTEAVMELLARQNIEAIPVCDLATVSDENWQTGIERFLGGNREALVVEGGDYDAAVRCYRKAKDADSRLRRVKLIKPDYDSGFHGTPKPGTAAALIESDNVIARGFLRGLMRNVVLVETEEELRRENRAITRDGMVAGNGAISGGNQFNYNLLGQNARRASAYRIKQEIDELVAQIQDVRSVFNPIETLNRAYESTIRNAEERIRLVNVAIDALAHFTVERNEIQATLESLKDNPDIALEEAFDKVDGQLKQLRAEKDGLLVSISTVNSELKTLEAEIPQLKAKREDYENQRKDITEQIDGDRGYAQDLYDRIEERLEEPDYESIRKEANQLSAQADKNADAAKTRGTQLLTAFLTEYEPEDRSEIQAMENPRDILTRCNEHIDRIEKAEMLGHEEDAREARQKMLENFRSEVVNNLNGNIKSLDQTFRTLNTQLKDLTFNNNRYRFKYSLVESESMKTVHDYVMSTTEEAAMDVGSMFDTDQDDPAIKLIENVLMEGRLDDIADYRNFFTYDIAATDQTNDTTRLFSNLLKSGSGGEKQTPFYVALGASFMSAYKIRKIGNTVIGGAALAIFDEAFSKMDGNNAQTALNFFREIGLQVILAAPPESEVKIGPYADTVYNILRTGQNVFIDRKHYTVKGSELLESDNPQVHEDLVEPYLNELKEEEFVE